MSDVVQSFYVVSSQHQYLRHLGGDQGSRKPNILNLHLIELAILLSHHGFVESFFCFRTGQGEQCKLTNKFLLPIKPVSYAGSCYAPCFPLKVDFFFGFNWSFHFLFFFCKSLTTKTRQPNPIIYRKLRRGSTAGRFQEKQIEVRIC